jgi:hypothetical protein
VIGFEDTPEATDEQADPLIGGRHDGRKSSTGTGREHVVIVVGPGPLRLFIALRLCHPGDGFDVKRDTRGTSGQSKTRVACEWQR